MEENNNYDNAENIENQQDANLLDNENTTSENEETDFGTNEESGQNIKPVRKKYVKPATPARKFWRNVLSSAVGFILANVAIAIIGLVLILCIVSFSSKSVSKHSVLELNLNGVLAERSTDLGVAGYFSNNNTIGLDDVLNAIEKAKTDDNIEGISLNLNSLSTDPASITTIRHALADFKKCGKFVYSYSDNYSLGSYYLASIADKVYLNPQGSVDFRGMSSQYMFYKGLIDTLGIDIQVVKHGKYKSAVEPYFLKEMSEENREQTTQLLNSIWNNMCQEISASRKVSVEKLNDIADHLYISNASDAVKLGLIDATKYRTDYNTELRSLAGVKDQEMLTLVSLSDYTDSKIPTASKKSSKKIAVVYAYGSIVDGEAPEGDIGATTLCREIRKAYTDKDVEAIVLRVNSPGGSALASEIIWNEIEQAKAAGKIVVTSMGGYAASGGYYISCNSNAIVAEPNTITGSIGVFGVIPSFERFLKSKVGITIDRVTTNAHADAITGYRAMDETEMAWMQKNVDETYQTFVARVAAGRKMSPENVDAIGQGRVWTGADALKIGLVDKLGDLDEAIALAASKAGADEYEVVNFPEKKSVFEQLMEQKNGQEQVNAALRTELGEYFPLFESLRSLREIQGTQASTPTRILIK